MNASTRSGEGAEEVHGSRVVTRPVVPVGRLARMLVTVGLLALCGCTLTHRTLTHRTLTHQGIDLNAVEFARLGFAGAGVVAAQRDYAFDEDPEVVIVDDEDEDLPGVGSAIVGELLAIFPGVLVPGTGHYFAGDRKTGARLLRIGEFGWLLTAAGGGMVLGGYALDRNDLEGTAYGLYGTGGLLGLVGVTYVLTAWFYDMIDTPRAVLSGGKPPPRSRFVESLDFFNE